MVEEGMRTVWLNAMHVVRPTRTRRGLRGWWKQGNVDVWCRHAQGQGRAQRQLGVVPVQSMQWAQAMATSEGEMSHTDTDDDDDDDCDGDDDDDNEEHAIRHNPHQRP